MSATIRARFDEFHQSNPHVYDRLSALALRLARRGRTRLSISQLFEVLRYEWQTETTESEPNLNNDYRALYSRMLMEREPELAGLFLIRKARSSVGIADGLATTMPDEIRRAA